MVKSRFSFGRVYLSYLLMLVFLGLAIYFFAHADVQTKTKFGNTMSMGWIGLFMVIICAFLFYSTAKWSNVIKVYDDTITINGIFSKKMADADQINSINFFAMKNPGSINGNSSTITTEIILTSGESILLPDIMYSNMYEIKQAIYEKFKQKVLPFAPAEKRSGSNAILTTEDEVFAGNQFTSMNGIFLYGSFIGFIVILINNQHLDISIIIAFLWIESIFYFGFGYQMNYFIISNDQLIIKNHFWFWYKKTYELNDIIEMNFEQPYKRSKSLRITTKDFKSKLYSAGSLRNKHWQALREAAITMSIPYRDYNA
jgi:hypothetical protein